MVRARPAGVRAKLDGHDFTGIARTNSCNQGKRKAGVQEALRESPDAVAGVVRAVRRCPCKQPVSAPDALNAQSSGSRLST